MRRRIYEVADQDSIGKDLERDCVLTLADCLSPEGRDECSLIFNDIEKKAINDMKLMHGGAELMHFLAENGLNRAVLTRNLEKNVPFMVDLYREEMKEFVVAQQEHMLEQIFHPVVARDTKSHPDSDEPLKAKPFPDGILHICKVWGCDPSEVIMVGDSANDDMAAANRAGCGGAVLLTQLGGGSLDTDSGYDAGDSEEEVLLRTPSLRVESLLELKTCMQALLMENSVGANGDKTKQASSNSLLYTSESGFTVEIPSIGVKSV